MRKLSHERYDSAHAWAYGFQQREIDKIIFPKRHIRGYLLVVMFHDLVAKRLGGTALREAVKCFHLHGLCHTRSISYCNLAKTSRLAFSKA